MLLHYHKPVKRKKKTKTALNVNGRHPSIFRAKTMRDSDEDTVNDTDKHTYMHWAQVEITG